MGSCMSKSILLEEDTSNVTAKPMTAAISRKSGRQKRELIVFGYIHDIERDKLLQQIIPSSIATVIMLFYPYIDEFRWDDTKYGKNLLIENDKTVRTIEAEQWAVCISPHEISHVICNWYEWEFKLNDWNTNTALEFGFIATPINETIPDWNDGMASNNTLKHYSINICCFDYFRLFGENITADNVSNAVMRHDKNGQKFIMKPKPGDRFKVRIDFNEKHIKLYYNDRYVNSVYNGVIPNSVVAAAALYDGSITATTSDYE